MVDYIRRESEEDPEAEIRRESRAKGIELDAVREVDSKGPGTTYRVLETDADDEADQIGFDVTHPGGPTGNQMFSNKLEGSMDALRQYLDGEDPNEADDYETETVSDDVVEERTSHIDRKQDDESESGRDETKMSRSTLDVNEGTMVSSESISGEDPLRVVRDGVQITLELTDDQLEKLEDGFGELIDERNERIDDLEQRVETLESALSGLANIGGDLDE